MLRVGVIGYGRRIHNMLRDMEHFAMPFRVAAIADPRADEIRTFTDGFLKECAYFPDADELLDRADELDGIMIGTRCFMHTEMACKAVRRKLPLFIEKPVAITFEQVRQLAQAFEGYPAPVVVSFPLRLTPIVQKVREMLEQGAIGEVEHVVAVNDVPYGRVYYNNWYRNFDQTGGLFLQKATHDFDYVSYLLGRSPAWVCAMNSRRVYGGDKPHELRCRDCGEMRQCPESSFNLFYETFNYPKGGQVERDWCVYSRDIRNEDSGNAILEYDNGVQLSYSQNFFARHAAARRGARLYGFKGTIEFDWYANRIRLFGHRAPTTSTIEFSGRVEHFGGDRELCWDWLLAMKERRPSRSGIEAGINSALTCLWARQSAEQRKFCEIRMPD